jgi:two-component system, cell cycle sensor histidine kinase and response regulator CckA
MNSLNKRFNVMENRNGSENENPIRVLMLEDSPQDAEIISELLFDSGLKTDVDHVVFEKDYESFLKNKKYDIILSDFMLPGFDAFGALNLCKEICHDTPFICVSGSVGEDTAVALLRQGAYDYILKDRLKRLPASIKNAIETAEEKIALKNAEESLVESEARFRNLYNEAPIGLFRAATDGKILLANEALIKMLGYGSFQEFSECNPLKTSFDDSSLRQEFTEKIEKDGEVKGLEGKWICKNSKIIFVRESAKVVRDTNGNILYYDEVVEDITLRRKAEKSLQESEERYRTLAGISPVGIFRTDSNGFTTYVNPKWCEIAGLSSEEAMGNGWLNSVHPADKDELSKHWEENKNIRHSSFAEYRFLHKDGSVSWVIGQAVPEMDEDNIMVGYVGTITDISARVQAENAKVKAENELKKNQERLNYAMEATSDGLFDTNAVTGEIYWSPRYFNILGYEPEEFHPTGDTYRKLIHPDDWDSINDNINLKGKNKETRFELIYRMMSKDQGWRWISSRFKIISLTEAGHPERMIGTITDITNTKLYEIDLKRKNRALKVLSGCNEVIIKTREEKKLLQKICDRIVGIGEYTLVWVGYAKDDIERSIIPQTWAGKEEGYLENMNISWGQNERGNRPAGIAIRTGTPYIIRDLQSDQNFIPWLSQAIRRGYRSTIALPLKENEHVFGALCIYSSELDAFDKSEIDLLSELANDLAYGIISIRTREKHDKLESQLLQSQKMEAIGKLAGGIAHDFNNLLTVIMGNSELVLSELEENSNMFNIMHRVILTTKKAASLTHQLLAFSRKQMVQPREIDLNTIVNETQKMLYRLLGEDIILKVNIETELMKIKADPGQIDQIIMNLVVNARDAMPNGGYLTIKTNNILISGNDITKHPSGSPGKFVCLEVSDTGTGISDEILPQIFDPFFTTKDLGKGTGLGLSVVYGVVKQNNGWIELETKIGIGTSFKIFLPGLEKTSSEVETNGFDINKYSGQGEKILIVEDDNDIRSMVKRTLEKNGYSISESKDLTTAKNNIMQSNAEFDLIFLDIVLPDGSGIEFFEKIHSTYPELKVLFTSGYADEKARWSIIQEKNYNFIQKPYETLELLKSIKKVISGKPNNN